MAQKKAIDDYLKNAIFVGQLGIFKPPIIQSK
jgi:hypothetical protein